MPLHFPNILMNLKLNPFFVTFICPQNHNKISMFTLDKGSVLFNCHRLGQISWAVHITPSEHCHMIGEKLHWNDTEETLETVHSMRHLNEVSLGHGHGLLVTLLTYDQRLATAGCDLLQTIHTLAVHWVSDIDKIIYTEKLKEVEFTL